MCAGGGAVAILHRNIMLNSPGTYNKRNNYTYKLA